MQVSRRQTFSELNAAYSGKFNRVLSSWIAIPSPGSDAAHPQGPGDQIHVKPSTVVPDVRSHQMHASFHLMLLCIAQHGMPFWRMKIPESFRCSVSATLLSGEHGQEMPDIVVN